jgi:predicted DNA-binding WGR domain protein
MTFEEFLDQTNAAGGLQTEDVLTAFLPLARVVSQWHEEGRVAPPLDWEALDIREDGSLALRSAVSAEPSINRSAVEALQRPAVTGLQVVGHGRITSDDDEGMSYQSLDVVEPGTKIDHPVYFVGYGAWEQAVGHHDALVDVFSLGMLLAALALGLDFNDKSEVERFVRGRDNLFGLNERLHPVLAAAIREMTVLDRHQRTGDLRSLIRRLETYRDQPVDLAVSKLPGFAGATPRDRRTLIKTHLRDRLFEVSRRNRLVYFRPTQSSVNLTVASVPLVIQLSSIRREHLFVARGDVLRELSECKAINLGKHLRFEDQPYLAGALDRLISEARRHRAEYGFAQLRLVLAFLHWHNLKEAPTERIVSPLLLLPVELTRKKGVKDHYVIEPTSSEAEVNPALRHHLKQLYDLDLPESLDLATTPLTAFHEELQRQIRATEPAVTLRLADEPQIELIHERARQRLAQFKRKQTRGAAGVLAKKHFDYSYQADGYKPLGLQLFREKVEHAPLPQRGAAGGIVAPRAPHIVPETLVRKQETERQTFALREQREGNPYLWDFDLCSVTLGNFNYRKMSLVRDYGALIAEQVASPAFDCVFPIEPRSIDSEPPAPLDVAAEWPVVDSDATQRAAVALARTGRSFIVQGPPGTGKSQTITNLIADYVARGKRVLFVCEKRAAIDVVFHRLRQQGLDELCCLIHDSQTDKKAFVQNLKQTYEAWIAQPDGADRARADRNAVLKRIQQDLDQLQRFDTAMSSAPEHIGGTVRELLHTLVALREHEPKLTARAAEQLPEYSIWRGHADLARRLCDTLQELSSTDSLARHPFRALSAELIQSDRPLQTLHEWTDRIESAIDAIEAALSESALPAEHWDTLEEVAQLASFGALLAGVVDRGQLSLLNEQSELSRSLKQAVDHVDLLQQAAAKADKATVNWRDKLAPADVEAALGLAQSKERSLFRFFSSQWRHLKRTLEARYDFSANAFRPTFTQVLKELKGEYDANDRLTEARAAAAVTFGTDLQALAATMSQAKASCEKPAVRQLRETLLSSPKAADIVRQLAALDPQMRDLLGMLPRLLREGFVRIRVAELGELMRDLRDNADVLPDLLPLLTELEESHEEFASAIRHYELNADALTAACARQSLEHLYRAQRWLPRFDGRTVERCAARISEAQQQWRTQNAAVIRSNLRQRFRQHVQLAMTSATQLDAEQKVFKKSYSSGRRELEHEFGKSMRFKSIRDLATGESGTVIRDLKPIWLMSPLSVSDTLPLETELFDAVIFDEASQIPVEEAVPALYRAPQVIIVGDEMQLPPTSFFSARAEATDEIEVEEDDERVAISLDADSLLTQSARNLPATLLAWHYRSRSESLIGFSNAAFYAGNLFTIPDREPTLLASGATTHTGGDPATNVDVLLSRPLTFHYMEASPYENRRNPGEAAYVAGLVRGLLQRGSPLSIGVVAFSEAQQTEIESALDALSEEDADFAAQLESAYVREENDQFCGLFVKNLENVQGDERDVIILSICYGPDREGRMLMNFGPINQRGGEKRLNVIFSRAKHHMAVVSSIRHHAITNDYNDGAAALKGFLQYAEFASSGDARSARAVLEGLNPLTRKASQRQAASDTVLEQLARALRARGHVVDENVGQSRFRCDLAVRAGDRREYRLGVFVDTEDYYGNGNVEERHVTRPGILRAFGWEVMTVLTRDWYHEPEGVLDRIERRLRGEAEPVVEDSLPEPAPVAEPGPKAEATTSPAAEPQPAAQESSETVRRRCEFVAGSSSKFWQVSRTGAVLTIQFGRIGTQGQTMTKSFDTPQRATNELEKLFAEKLRKGYKAVQP